MFSFNTPGPGSYAIPSDFGNCQIESVCNTSHSVKRGNGSRTATKSKEGNAIEKSVGSSKDLTESNKMKHSSSMIKISRESKVSQN